MLKVRIIPTLLWKNLGLVKGKGFNSWRPVGTVLPSVKVYNTREVDELVVVNITSTLCNEDLDLDEIRNFTQECFVPLTIGGGIKNIEQVKNLLRAGADKVSINTAAYADISIIEAVAGKFGKQCVVASVDTKKTGTDTHECFSHCGTKSTGLDPVQWCKKLEDAGAGEILLTSIERDGTMTGYDLEIIQKVSQAVRIPVIASGGAGTYEHMLQAIQAGASAVAAAAMFHFTEQTPREAKNYLKEHGIAARDSAREVL